MRAWRILLVILAAVYLIQVCTPLRLGADQVVLMAEGESVAQGTGFLDHGVKTPFPPGYPALLALLIKLGLARPWFLIAFNLACLALGLAAVSRLLQGPLEQSRVVALEIVCAFLLSYVVIKHTAMPLTDVPFFGLSMSCLAALAYAERQTFGKRFYLAACIAGPLFLGALSLRMVGVALVPVFLWIGLSRKEFRRLLHTQSPRARAIALIAVILVVSPIAVFQVWSYTTEVYRVAARGSSPSSMARAAIIDHATEIGELAANVPQRQLPPSMQIIPFFCLGIAISVVILVGLLHRRDRICSIEVYFIAYVGIILVWPYRDPRFWIPILPLVMAYARVGLSTWPRTKFWTPYLRAFKLAFALTGVVALIYTTRLSLSGSDFPDRYATGPLRTTYCVAINACGGHYDVKEVDPKVLHLLQTYR
jgi:hypothetical protein